MPTIKGLRVSAGGPARRKPLRANDLRAFAVGRPCGWLSLYSPLVGAVFIVLELFIRVAGIPVKTILEISTAFAVILIATA